MMAGGYWRNGPVLNNAVSGVDMALWDIKGKLAGAPVYELWGGRCRPAAAVYRHADGKTEDDVLAGAREWVGQGCRFVRCQLGGYEGLEGGGVRPPDGAHPGRYYDPGEKRRRIPALFERLRAELGDEVGLIYDVHERFAPADAVAFARDMEPYRLLFLEDLVAPEEADLLRRVRQVCTTPLALGELFVNPREYVPLIAEGLIDFVRVHPSFIGGATPALKLAHLCEPFGVRTAWHGPGDLSPIGMAANVHLDVAVHNFGVQEYPRWNQLHFDMFPGAPEVRDGYVRPPDKPGWGVGFDEGLARKYPCKEGNPTWTAARWPDGTIRRP
jgi:mannonate dehydratase